MEVGNEDKSPMHYLLKVKSFSQLSEVLSETTEKRCESTTFVAGRYKWKLVLYPVGDRARNGDGHISLYLMIVETRTLPRGWTVHANFQFFVYDHIQDRFCTFGGSDAKISCFHAMKTELGFPRLLSLEDFKDPSTGFLVGDTCFFGIQVLVQDYIENLECLPTSKGEDKTLSWKIRHFSEQNEEMIESESFIAGGFEWVVQLYPKGDPISKRNSGGHLSIYLKLKDSTAESELACARCSLVIKDQYYDDHLSFTATAIGSSFKYGRGWPQFITLSRLQNPANGFLVGDTLIVEAKVEAISKLQNS
ncbi:hypothetical protein SLEP1_g21910 [Rubroshorea leprosula]|uniref:MATH domain-containing protein n=1 Tax=Rubroshorea leprosula TaxID=152421 RepID=A0AAV5JCY3_9ROSI|nr:hypothetical protein SLEP1_g21910 [Rubroshorea leprosula]